MSGVNEWRSMSSAPRDGTFVELECTYGVAPWYCLARWTDEIVLAGKTTFKSHQFSWQKPWPDNGGPFDEHSLRWRSYNGIVSSYIDPTGGQQNDAVYWRKAVARKYGLPEDHFEKYIKSDVDNEHRPSFWLRIKAAIAKATGAQS